MVFEYFILLLVCVVLCFLAGFYFRVVPKVLISYKRLLFAVIPTFLVFFVWDYYAITRGHWFFNERYVTGLRLLDIPLEEIAFFVIIPVLAIVTWEIIGKVINSLLKVKYD